MKLRYIALAVLAVVAGTNVHAQRPAPFADSTEPERIVQRLETYFALAARDTIFTPEMIEEHTVDEMAQTLEESSGRTSWFDRYRIEQPVSLGFGDSLAMVNVVVSVDSLRWFGRVDVDWTYFLRRGEYDGWRIGAVRRFVPIDKNIQMFKALDTAADYPASLKPLIVAENSPILFSNAQIRDLFARHRSDYRALADAFIANDSLIALGRISNRIVQLNHHVIEWGVASHDVPDAAVEEFMATLSPDQQAEMRAQLNHARRLAREGFDSVRAIARRATLYPEDVIAVVERMQRLHVSFVNTRLPWSQAVQLTLAGELENAVGLLYSPNGEVPLVSPSEYYYIEDLGDGWWLFRAT